MAQQYIFIDTENVSTHYDKLYPVIKKNAKIVFFYTDANQEHGLSYKIKAMLTEKNTQPTFLYCKNGQKNSLDITLAGQLGYTICKLSLTRKTPSEFIIYSDDKGYDSFVTMMSERGFNIRRVSAGSTTIKNPPNSKKLSEASAASKDTETPQEAPKGPPVITDLKEQPSNLEEASEGVKRVCLAQYKQHLGSAGLKLPEQKIMADIILKAQAKAKSEQLQYIHQLMRNNLGNNRTQKLYTKLKPTIKRILLECQKP